MPASGDGRSVDLVTALTESDALKLRDEEGGLLLSKQALAERLESEGGAVKPYMCPSLLPTSQM